MYYPYSALIKAPKAPGATTHSHLPAPLVE